MTNCYAILATKYTTHTNKLYCWCFRSIKATSKQLAAHVIFHLMCVAFEVSHLEGIAHKKYIERLIGTCGKGFEFFFCQLYGLAFEP